MIHSWTVIDTPCRPARWKVCKRNNPYADNSTHNYFRRIVDAKEEARKRNLRDEIDAKLKYSQETGSATDT